MSGPPKAVAAARVSVKAALASRLEALADSTATAEAAPRLLVGVSGGADSLALAATVHWVGARMGLETEAAIIDHGLSDDSASVTERAAAQCERLGIGTVMTRQVAVTAEGGGGLENAARTARYAALEQIADERRSLALLLGHTLSDQAEQVLLGLARGAGARSLAGIPRSRDLILRPFLGTGRTEETGLWRSDTRAICEALDIDVWEDPMNADRDYLRVAARLDALPALERSLGEHIARNLVRTADLLADDAQYLEEEAAHQFAGLRRPERPGEEDLITLDVYALAALHRALRTRVLKMAAVEAERLHGTPSSKSLLRRHVLQIDSLVSAYSGQGPVLLPGRIEARRENGLLVFAPGLPDRTSHAPHERLQRTSD